jgi:hypothetical protein
MKEIIGPILEALAGADSGTVILPLSSAYPAGCVDAVAGAFSNLCTARVEAGRLILIVSPLHRESAGRISGEFLNYLLAVAAQKASG